MKPKTVAGRNKKTLKNSRIGLDKPIAMWYNTFMKNNEQEKRFWIGFDGFDSLKLHFTTREEAEQHLSDNRRELFRHCEYSIAVYEKL